jgi:autotransporter-associated beta strand protein
VTLTKTGSGTVRFAQNAFLGSLNILGGRVETLSSGGVIDAWGITLGGSGAVNPTLALGRPQQVSQLFVAPETTGATVDLNLASSAVNFGSVILASPLTIRRSLPATTSAGLLIDGPILGGTAPGTDALVFTALNPASPSYWQVRGTGPIDFTGNVRFAVGKWSLAGLGLPPNWFIPDASLMAINAPAQVTWAVSQLNETIDGLAGQGTLQLSGVNNTLTINADNPANEGARVFVGGLSQSGTANWVFGGAGTQVLAGNRITYSGPTTLNSGTLVLRDATAFASSVALNGGTLELEATSGNWTFGKSIIGGAGELVKSGAGTVTLTAAATHRGRTLINGGILALGAGGSLANTSEVVLNGGSFNVSALPGGYQVSALLGTGSIGGTVTVTSRLAIGNSPGTMSFENLILGAGSTAEFEVTGGGTAADLANVSGQLNLNGAALSVIQLGTYTPNQKYTLFAYAFGNLLGTFKDLPDGAEFVAAGGPWRIDYDDLTAGLNGGTGNRFVTLTAVPEPAAASILALALAATWRRRRR